MDGGLNIVGRVVTVSSSERLLTTGSVCKAAHVTRGQLRLYEEQGLITPQSRTESGYRQYGVDTLDRIRVILFLKQLGLTLSEIALLLSDRDRGVIDEQAIQRWAREFLSKIDQHIADLQAIRSCVDTVAAGDMSAFQNEDCNLIFEFMNVFSREK